MASEIRPAARASRTKPERTKRPACSKRGTMSTAKPNSRPKGGKVTGRAGTIETEMEVEADRDPSDGEALDQNLRDEILRGKLRQSCVEAQHDRAVEASAAEKAQLRLLVREPEQRFVRTEESARMRLEGERRGGAPKDLRARASRSDHRAMPAMDAIEIPDGDHRATQRVVQRPFASDDGEALAALWLLDHGLLRRAKAWRRVQEYSLVCEASFPLDSS